MSGPARLAVVDYGIGNLRSAQRALEHVGADARLTDDQRVLDAADAVVLPGVGAFGACMAALRKRGLDEPVRRAATDGRPFLGICVGMQMLFTGSEEDPGARGLDLISGTVRWIPPGVKRPQMQWNRLDLVRPDDPLFEGLGTAPWVYFVHSLHGVPDDPAAVTATCEYGGTLHAAVRAGAIVATQFHPEKSAAAGLHLLATFARLASASAAA